MIACLLFLAIITFSSTAHAQLMGILGTKMERCEPACGLIISDIAPGSPAHQAGLLPGDVIAQIDGKDVHNDEIGAFNYIRSNPGKVIYLTIFRNGFISRGPVRLGAIPAATNHVSPNSQPMPSNNSNAYPSSPSGTTIINNNIFGNINQENTTNQHGNGNNANQSNRR